MESIDWRGVEAEENSCPAAELQYPGVMGNRCADTDTINFGAVTGCPGTTEQGLGQQNPRTDKLGSQAAFIPLFMYGTSVII